MSKTNRILTCGQEDGIRAIARIVQRRRNALGLTQVALDVECGFKVRRVQWIERTIIDRRSLLADDPDVLQALETLCRLERVPQKVRPVPRVDTRRRTKREGSPPPAQVLRARLYECPDHSMSLTKSACDDMRGCDPVCMSLRSGLGCRGVVARRLPFKDIEVPYRPPRSRDGERPAAGFSEEGRTVAPSRLWDH